jgi:triosephosphate isomerase
MSTNFHTFFNMAASNMKLRNTVTKSKLLVANWKMYLSPFEEMAFIEQYAHTLANLTSHKKWGAQLVICPSFLSIASIGSYLTSARLASIALGSQDCCSSSPGPHTGQVWAKPLKDLGCSYAIIGHSETRTAHRLTSKDVGKKAVQILQADITPIICVGETADQHNAGTSIDAIRSDLKIIAEILTQYNYHDARLFIAYEPIWAIGSKKPVKAEYLEKMLNFLDQDVRGAMLSPNISFLYGGSINSQTIGAFAKTPFLAGYLVGSASLSFQELEKMLILLSA